MVSSKFNIPLIDLVKEHFNIQDELNAAWNNVIASGTFIKGKYIQKFEEELQKYTGIEHVISCGNGTDALQLAYMALDLKSGDEIIIPAFNYVAAAEAAVLLGLKPIFADVNPNTFTIDLHSVENCLTNNTKAIVAVNLFGACADLEALKIFCSNKNIYLIEDNAQAIGANILSNNGKKTFSGAYGIISTTSFFPTKNLGAMGDGGAIFTSDKTLAQKIRSLANHGQTIQYNHVNIGINSRLDAIQAAVLSVKLKNLDANNDKRIAIASKYNEALKNHPDFQIPFIQSNTKHVYHQYTLVVQKNRDQLKDYLKLNGINSGIYYHKCTYNQDAYIHLKPEHPCKNAEILCRQVLSIPVHPALTDDEVNYIIEILLKWKNKEM